MITVITPTGDRPEAFELTRRWMYHQSLQPDQWIVVDDGKIPMPDYMKVGIDYVRREPKENEGHTLVLNIGEAVKHIKGDMILIVEDDDWYGPDYIYTMSVYLDRYDLVGERYARYYHLPAMKYRRIGNSNHASFCQTGFTSKIMGIFMSCLDGDPYIDARLWSAVQTNKFLITDTEDNLHLHCSLKGLKGRKGIGSGHGENASYYNVDTGLEYLIKWVGEENARIYMNHVGQSFESAKLIGVDRKAVKFTSPKGFHQTVQKRTVTPAPLVRSKPLNDITVITCTGDRPESFELCKRWMNGQTIKPDQWIVVDDGDTPIIPTNDFEYYYRHKTPQDYTHTLCLNLMMALQYVRNKKVIIFEDDDWYHPTYINYMNILLDKADLVGIGNLIFYYPKINGYLEKKTVKQPALAQTAFTRPIIPIIEQICQLAPKEFELCGKGLIDSFLWKAPLEYAKKNRKVKLLTSLKTSDGRVIPPGTIFSEPIPEGIIKKAAKGSAATFIYENDVQQSTKLIVNCDKYISVGVKGMPGRKGLTTHHKEDNNKYTKDPTNELVRSIIKNDINFYLELFS